MTGEEIHNSLTDIIKDVLDNDSIVLSRDTTAADIEEWDSLAHISIIVAVEKEFKIKFDLMDIKPLKNVGEFLDLIQRKIS
jgi:acyl carrier protein